MAAQPPPNFALAPNLAGAGVPIDYSTRAGQALYSNATQELAYVFNGKDSSLPAFLQAIRDRVASCGWNDIFDITVAQDANGNDVFKNILTQHGEITLQQVRANAEADYIGAQNRNAQISHQVYQCLRKSIGPSVTERLVTETDKYFMGQPPHPVPDGPAFLFTIISIYSVTTKATPMQTRIKLSDAHNLMVELDYDVDKFNNEINSYIQQLSSNGETSVDVFAHVSRAYKNVKDDEFKRYMNSVIDNHNDGTRTITYTGLMDKAKTKYEELKQEGIWLKRSHTEEDLVALTAQLDQVKLQNKQLASKLKKGQGYTPKNNNNNKKGGKPKANPKNKGKANNDNKWAWKEVKPKPGQTKIEFEGKTYYWCTHHKKWTLHKSAECRLNKDNQSAEEHANLQAVYNPDDEGAFPDK